MKKSGYLLACILIVTSLLVACKKEDVSSISGDNGGGNEVTPTPTVSIEDEELKSDEDKEAKEDEKAKDDELASKKDLENETNSEREEEIIKEFLSKIPLKATKPVEYRFFNTSVHDPSIIQVDDTYYIFGSHLAVAKTTDLMNWTAIANGVTKGNPVIPDAMTEMEEAFTWAKTNTFWAPDVIQLEDGRFYMYYCNCEGSSPLAALGVAVADKVEGPYKDLGIILKSGYPRNVPDEDGNVYDANVDPNAIDPCLFYDKDNRLWMIYGSYSGGIFILEMDPKTGFPLEEGYGKKLLGKNHLRIEGAFIQYSEETDYYYMFLSFGGLAADGGYNIRIARSKNPDGPYYDSAGNDMIECQGPAGTFFNDRAAEKYGVKLMGNFHWNSIEGEEEGARVGYISPGHNSTLYQEETGKYFLIFHTRFEGKGEMHQVRVHQMFLNEDDWFVVAPYRYVGETIGTYTKEDVVGVYKMINHGREITHEVKKSTDIFLMEDNTIIGDVQGRWELKGDNTCILTIENVTYKGVFLKQWDEFGLKNVMTFSVLSEEGVALWGSGYEAKE